jgi:hypothetical protein
MLTMYKMFTKNPSKDRLATIINNAKRIVSEATTDLKGTGFTKSVAKAYSDYWLMAIGYEPSTATIEKINENFNQILLDVDTLLYISISEDARAIYLNVIQSYAEKIAQLYKI